MVWQRGRLDSFPLPHFRTVGTRHPREFTLREKGKVQIPNSAEGGHSMARSPNPHHSPPLPVLGTPWLPSPARPPNPILPSVCGTPPSPHVFPSPGVPAPRAPVC